MLVIPAIDLRNGRCLDLSKGPLASETVYEGDPQELAAHFEAEGAPWLHVVDLDGALEGEPKNLEVLKSICGRVNIPVQFGGGIRSLSLAKAALAAGVARVVLGSTLIKDPNIGAAMLTALGERGTPGIDVKDGKVVMSGWTEAADRDPIQVALWLESSGARRFIVTDASREAEMSGPNFDFLKLLTSRLRRPVIASGGVGSLDDIDWLVRLSLEGVIVGRALYEGRFTLAEAAERARKR